MAYRKFYPYAYVCSCEEGAGVYFADTEERALVVSEAETAERAPEFDQWWPLQYVPPAVLVNAHHWTWRCDECDCQFDAGEVYDWDNDERFAEPVSRYQNCFCSPECMEIWQQDYLIRRVRRQQVETVLRSQYRGAQFTYLDGSSAEFQFPGGKHSVQWRIQDHTHVSLAQSDVPAWREWRRLQQKQVS